MKTEPTAQPTTTVDDRAHAYAKAMAVLPEGKPADVLALAHWLATGNIVSTHTAAAVVDLDLNALDAAAQEIARWRGVAWGAALGSQLAEFRGAAARALGAYLLKMPG